MFRRSAFPVPVFRWLPALLFVPLDPGGQAGAGAEQHGPGLCFSHQPRRYFRPAVPLRGPEDGRELPQLCQSRRVQNSIFHRSVPGFIIQGGGYTLTRGRKSPPSHRPAGGQ